jgi:hypothetical protein
MDDVITKLAGYFLLQLLDAVGAELDDVAGIHVDQMIVVIPAGLLESRRPTFEGMAVDSAHFLQKFHRPVDRRQRDALVDRLGTAEDFKRVGMVFRLTQYIQDDLARTGDADARLAQRLFVIGLLGSMFRSSLSSPPSP